MTWRKGNAFRTLRRLVRLTGPRAVVPFLLVFALILPFAWRALNLRFGHDEDIELGGSVRSEQSTHLVNVRMSPVQVERVLDTVENGLRAQVIFVIRHYGPSDDFTEILGDTLVQELSVSRTLSYDPFTSEYLVEDSRGVESRHDSVVNAIHDLYRADDIEVAHDQHDSDYFDTGTGEIRARGIVNTMVLSDPVFLVAPLLNGGMRSSPWVPLPSNISGERRE